MRPLRIIGIDENMASAATVEIIWNNQTSVSIALAEIIELIDIIETHWTQLEACVEACAEACV